MFLRSCKAKEWTCEETREMVGLANQSRCHPPLEENEKFEEWFTRQWKKPDRAFGVDLLSGLRGV
jgi:hypothetical protein